jgi:hypothetical protein
VIAHRPGSADPPDQIASDQPHVVNGRQLTLREALADLAARGDVGSGGLVELDGDGRPK